MRTITCIDCEQQFRAVTKDELLHDLLPHYLEKHPNVLEAANEEFQLAWFTELDKRWDEAADGV